MNGFCVYMVHVCVWVGLSEGNDVIVYGYLVRDTMP